MTTRYAVTFEFETKPPLTLQGTVSAAGMPTCVARAARTAMREAGRQAWASVVVVIEREHRSVGVGEDVGESSRPAGRNGSSGTNRGARPAAADGVTAP